jgi:anti-anti-sigma factor
MKATLRIIKEQVQGNVHVTVLHLHGWLDAQGEPVLLAAARDSYEEGSRYVLLDLAKIDALTSAGIRAMQKVYKIFTPVEERPKMARVKLCNAPPQIHNVLGISGFLLTIINYESMQAAIDSFTE